MMGKLTARAKRGGRVREVTETEADRFEFARRHIRTLRKLEDIRDEAHAALVRWYHPHPVYTLSSNTSSTSAARRPRTPEEREELKSLKAAYDDSCARLLLHENDGRNL